MTGSKPWYTSKTIWSGLVTLLVLVGGFFGYNISPEEQKEIVVQFMAIAGAVGSLATIVSRKVATKRIG